MDQVWIEILGGIFLLFVGAFINKALNRRGILKYKVVHTRLGLTASDNTFGNVRVTWNDQEFDSLWLSKVELTNASSRDYKNVEVKLYGGKGTFFLTESTQIEDTIDRLEHTESFKKKIAVNESSTEESLVASRDYLMQQREYIASILNRGQKITFGILTFVSNSEESTLSPYIGVSILHEGIKVKQEYEAPSVSHIWSIPIREAALIGFIISIAIVYFTIEIFGVNPLVLWFSFMLGAVAQIPGVISLRIYRKINEWFTG